MKSLSRVRLFATPWTVPYHAPPSMGFSRQSYWSGFPFPSPKGTIERKKVKSLSRVQLFATPWTVPYHAPPSMEFTRQEYWSGLPFPSPSFNLKPHLFLPTLSCFQPHSPGCQTSFHMLVPQQHSKSSLPLSTPIRSLITGFSISSLLFEEQQ